MNTKRLFCKHCNKEVEIADCEFTVKTVPDKPQVEISAFHEECNYELAFARKNLDDFIAVEL